MKLLRLIGLTFGILGCFGLSTAFGQQEFKTTTASVIAYLEYLPEDYNANSDKYPIVIFLHGIGERGPNSTDPAVLSQYIQNVAKHGPPKHVKNGVKFPFILISPQLKNNYSRWSSTYVKEVIDHCKTYLRIDQRRIIITGLSLGGGGTWTAAQDYPELFAAVAPVCGGYNDPAKACGIARENIPVWAFHGDKDTVVPLVVSQRMVNAINACVPQPSPLAKLTIYSGVAHNAWDYAYRTDNSLHTPNLYEWLMSFTNVANKGNRIPLANAGTDKSCSSRSLSISGTGSDTDGSIVAYSWKKLTGPAATLTNVNTTSLSLANLQLGQYVFSLQVTDNNGNLDTDYVSVTVVNALPVANAGVDQQITLPANSITLTGTGQDPDGSINGYQWTQTAGTAATLTNVNTSILTASNLVAGTYGFQLKVTDNFGATATDEVSVVVKPATLPVVNAGADKIVRLPTTSATLIGSATDPDGSIVAYLWTKISGAGCTMYNTTSSSLKLGALVSGTYVFRLMAKDNDGNSASDDIIMVVDAPPVAYAGVDKTVNLPLTSPLILTGSATDKDGTVVKYQWSKYTGPSVTVTNSSTASLSISKMYAGTYVFKFAATDNYGVIGYDYVTITVKDPVISGSGRTDTEDADVFSEEALDDQNQSDEFIGSMVAIYNAAGERLYAGVWSKETESEIMNAQGLYFYNIFRNGVRIRSGKIFKRDF